MRGSGGFPILGGRAAYIGRRCPVAAEVSAPGLIVPHTGQLSIAQIQLVLEAAAGLILEETVAVFTINEIALGGNQLHLKLIAPGDVPALLIVTTVAHPDLLHAVALMNP